MAYTNRRWTEEEDALMLKRIEAGESQISVAQSTPGRTYSSAISRIGRLREGYGGDHERRKARNASEKLWTATMRLMAKMDRQVLEDLLWPVMRETVPGTERIYKTSSAERMAA